MLMADHWLALQVVRELEEVGARYFALSLSSPCGLQCLVSVVSLFRETSHPCAPSNPGAPPASVRPNEANYWAYGTILWVNSHVMLLRWYVADNSGDLHRRNRMAGLRRLRPGDIDNGG